MNILIPIGGIGERFSKEGYLYPKPLINILGKPMIFWVISSLKIEKSDSITIIYKDELDSYNFESLLRNQFPNIPFSFVKLYSETRGAAETVLCGLNTFTDEQLSQPIMIADCDTFYTDDVVSKYKNVLGNCIFYFTDNGDKPLFSYIELDGSKVVSIKEKIQISQNANTGLYCFSSGSLVKKYCEKILNKVLRSEFYISNIYDNMLKDNLHISAIRVNDFNCVGTPFQLQLFASNNMKLGETLRFCFDLDNTLVSYPKIKNDYSSVEPITNNINLAKFLKNNGHTIIINTARRMKTRHGNVGAVIADIGLITLNTIKQFDIPCDELYFGKPYAHFYLDDLGINPYNSDVEKQMGFYNTEILPRTGNTVIIDGDKVIKTSTKNSFEGEKYWYKNIPTGMEKYFPNVYEISDKLVIENIKGLTFSNLYVNGSLTQENLVNLIKSLEELHKSQQPTLDINIYDNYHKKLEERYFSFDYSGFDYAQNIYCKLIREFRFYSENNYGTIGVIHGDPVFTNVILQKDNTIKFIDMRGKVGNTLTIYGDIFYDFAKIYQSLIGYDHILAGQKFKPYNNFIPFFEDYINKNYNNGMDKIKLITKSLLFSLIPLHNNDKCEKYFNLMGKIKL